MSVVCGVPPVVCQVRPCGDQVLAIFSGFRLTRPTGSGMLMPRNEITENDEIQYSRMKCCACWWMLVNHLIREPLCPESFCDKLAWKHIAKHYDERLASMCWPDVVRRIIFFARPWNFAVIVCCQCGIGRAVPVPNAVPMFAAIKRIKIARTNDKERCHLQKTQSISRNTIS